MHAHRCLLPLLAFLVAASSCAELPAIPRDQCGNGVLDPGEDCDDTTPGGACGDAGTAHECRYLCDRAATPPSLCPTTDHYACGSDNVCRLGAGSFTPAPTSVGAGADFIGTGDFGKLGRKSIYAQSLNTSGLGAPQLFAFDATGKVTESGGLPAALGVATVVDFDKDGFDDAITRTISGTVILRGRTATSLSPEVFDTYRPDVGDVVRVGIVPTNGPFEQGMLLAKLARLGGKKATWVVARDSALGRPIAVIPADIHDLSTHAAAVIDEDPLAVCRRPVFAIKQVRKVFAITPCAPNGEWAQPLSPAAPALLFETQFPIVDGVWSLRLDEDQNDDLLVLTQDGKEGQSFWEVGFGDAAGHFFSRPLSAPNGLPGQTASVRVYAEDKNGVDFGTFLTPALTTPLDVAWVHRPLNPRLPASNVLVLVGNRMISTTTFRQFPSGNDPAYIGLAAETDPKSKSELKLRAFPTYIRTEAWDVARVGDVNRDGEPDVVAGGERSFNLELFTGTTAGLFNPSVIRTDATTRSLALGDFDGDLVTDVAFSSPHDSETDDLRIAFGRPLAPPGQVLLVGTYPPIVQIEAGRLPPVSGFANPDQIFDLGLVTSFKGQESLAVLEGSGDRLPLAPLNLNVGGSTGKSVQNRTLAVSPALVAAGPDFRLDMLGIEGLEGAELARMWRLDGASGALTYAASPVAGCQPEGRGQVLTAHADFNLDGSEESVFLAVCSVPPENRKGPQFLVASNDVDQVSGPFPFSLAAAPDAIVPVALVAGDVDGDGDADLVATFARFPLTDDIPQIIEALTKRVEPITVVVWNRDGVLDFTKFAQLTPGGNPTVRAATFVDIAGKQRLVVSGGPRLHVVTSTAEAFTFAPFPFSPDAEPQRVRSLAAGDVTGDGIEDLIVGTSGSGTFAGELRVLVGNAKK